MVDRRTLLEAGGLAAAAGALAIDADPAAARTDIGVSVYPFPLSAVTLLPGPFLDNMNRTLAYLSFVDADRLLYNFRVNYGISTSAQACGGWESPSTELRGHSVGHVLTNLYQLTGNADQLTTAQRFDHAQILNPLASNQDQLNGFHANTQIPKIIGAIREYHATGTTRYRDFQTPDAIASQLSDNTCENCNTYNMLKLTRQLFFTNPARADYLDYYERALLNQILGQQDPNSTHGFVAYYTPLRAGGIKTYSNDYDDFTCDHGTGMESNTKYMDTIYFYSGEALYVNLFTPSVLTWPGRGITVRQDTTFPSASTSRLTVTGSGHIALKVRVPSWVNGMTVRLNGSAVSVTATPGTYLTVDRTWASGDVVDLTMPATLTFPRTTDNSTVGAAKYGAVVLAGQYGSTDLGSRLPTLNTGSLAQDPANPLHFTGTASTGPVSLLPFHQTHHQRYTVYWTISTSGGGGGGNSYEAEASGNTLAGQAAVRSSAGASGGSLVGYVGSGTANDLQFNNVSAASAGSHTVTVYYTSGENRSMTLSPNRGYRGQRVHAAHGRVGHGRLGVRAADPPVRQQHHPDRNPSGWAPDIDRIVVG
jgi:uncharacterized protein